MLKDSIRDKMTSTRVGNIIYHRGAVTQCIMNNVVAIFPKFERYFELSLCCLELDEILTKRRCKLLKTLLNKLCRQVGEESEIN